MQTIKNVKVQLNNEYINIKIPLSLLSDVRKTKNWSILDKVRGIWKNKKFDALEYQKNI